MATPYYQGDNVPIEFTVEYGGSPVTPTYAYVAIKKPNHIIINAGNATINGNSVYVVIDEEYTDIVGLYDVEFKLGMPYGERTHFGFYEIKKNLT